VAGVPGLPQDLPADPAGGGDDRELHDVLFVLRVVSEWRLGWAWYVSPTTAMSTQGEKCILPRRWPQAADTDRTTAAGGG